LSSDAGRHGSDAVGDLRLAGFDLENFLISCKVGATI
jgi:hypothetical protein